MNAGLEPVWTSVEEIGWFEATEPSGAAKARRAAAEAGRRLGLADARVGELAVAVAEIGSNLTKHAQQGRMTVRCLRRGDLAGVEVVALDAGPGMSQLEASWRDGHSTAGSLGIGLGAIERLSTWHDVYSLPGRGTVLAARFFGRGQRLADSGPAGLTRPMTGESVSGDRYAVRESPSGPLLMVADGLGHGPLAAAASAEAVATSRLAADGPAELVERIHAAARRTRGCAVGVAKLEREAGVVRFAGLGNIAAFVVGDRRRAMVSLPGIAGHRRQAVREFTVPIASDGVVVLHSDGVSADWNLATYPGILGHSPVVIAGTLLRDAGVRRDDACVLVAKAAP